MAVVGRRPIFNKAGFVAFQAEAHLVIPSVAELVRPNDAHAFVNEPPIQVELRTN